MARRPEFSRNWMLKLIALILAVLLWAVVKGDEPARVRAPAPVGRSDTLPREDRGAAAVPVPPAALDAPAAPNASRSSPATEP